MSADTGYSILPLGDSALLVHFGEELSEQVYERVLFLYRQLKAFPITGVLDLVPAYASLGIYYDVVRVRSGQSSDKTAFETVAEKVEQALSQPPASKINKPSLIKVPVCYSGPYSPDLSFVMEQSGLSAEEVIRLHTSRTYLVYMLGFLPGFPYMGQVDERLQMPRKEQPRQRVEAGSVGIAGRQTGIYSLSSPGGWQIIGRTPLRLFDPGRENSVLFQPGDEVAFYSISEDEFENYQGGHS